MTKCDVYIFSFSLKVFCVCGCAAQRKTRVACKKTSETLRSSLSKHDVLLVFVVWVFSSSCFFWIIIHTASRLWKNFGGLTVFRFASVFKLKLIFWRKKAHECGNIYGYIFVCLRSIVRFSLSERIFRRQNEAYSFIITNLFPLLNVLMEAFSIVLFHDYCYFRCLVVKSVEASWYFFHYSKILNKADNIIDDNFH